MFYAPDFQKIFLFARVARVGQNEENVTRTRNCCVWSSSPGCTGAPSK